MTEQISWSHKSLEELERFYWDEIAHARRRDGYDPGADRPSYAWLADNGYSGLAYALREHHDRTVKQFFTDVVGIVDEAATGFAWKVADEETVEWLETFVDARMRRVEEGKRAASTVETKRSRLARYVRAYERRHGDAALVSEARDPSAEADAYDRALATFRDLQVESDSEASVARVHEAVDEWYEFLANRRRAAFNPVTGIDGKHGLDLSRSSPDKPGLSADQVARVYDAAATPEERLVVIGLAGLGLRRSEVASLHVSQLALGEDAHVAFEERKNGPGEVSVLYGREALAARIDALEGDDWNGYLFPSRASAAGHVTGETINDRFGRLCDRAGVRLAGETPTSHACRRFWYRAYQRAMTGLLETMQAVAADQGASSAEVVVRDYLDEASRRDHRQRAMRERLSDVFEGSKREGRTA